MVTIVVECCGEVSLELELHVALRVLAESDPADGSVHPVIAQDKADLKHVVLRVRSQTNTGARMSGGIATMFKFPPTWDTAFYDGIRSISSIDQQMSRLPYLDTLTLETMDDIQRAEYLRAKGTVQPMRIQVQSDIES